MNARTSLLLIAICSVLLSAAGDVAAGTFPASTARQPLYRAEDLSRLSIGGDYEAIKRELTFTGPYSVPTLDATAYGGFLAYDVLPWLAPFLTVGASEAKAAGARDYGSGGTKWSAGLGVYFWDYDVKDPDYLAGRLTIKGVVEYASYESEKLANRNNTISWTDISASLPFGYEVFGEESLSGVQMSINLYVGPAVSIMEGDFTMDGRTTSFEGKKNAGFIAGADVYFAHNLSFGGQVTSTDDMTVRGMVRYHF